jgi:hypothetical protein
LFFEIISYRKPARTAFCGEHISCSFSSKYLVPPIFARSSHFDSDVNRWNSSKDDLAAPFWSAMSFPWGEILPFYTVYWKKKTSLAANVFFLREYAKDVPYLYRSQNFSTMTTTRCEQRVQNELHPDWSEDQPTPKIQLQHKEPIQS